MLALGVASPATAQFTCDAGTGVSTTAVCDPAQDPSNEVLLDGLVRIDVELAGMSNLLSSMTIDTLMFATECQLATVQNELPYETCLLGGVAPDVFDLPRDGCTDCDPACATCDPTPCPGPAEFDSLAWLRDNTVLSCLPAGCEDGQFNDVVELQPGVFDFDFVNPGGTDPDALALDLNQNCTCMLSFYLQAIQLDEVPPSADVSADVYESAAGFFGECPRPAGGPLGSRAESPELTPIALCGNGDTETGEQCDDQNTDPCDGCRPDCTIQSCGDGIVDCGETCDPNDAAPGAPTNCRLDGDPAACTYCGDNTVDAGEMCDDGNTDPGDGCSPVCEFECALDLQKEASCDGIAFEAVPDNCTPEACAELDCRAGESIAIRYTAKNLCPVEVCDCALSESNPQLPANLMIGCMAAGEERIIYELSPMTCQPGVTDVAEPDTATFECRRTDNDDVLSDTDRAWFDCVDCDVMIGKKVRCTPGGPWVEFCAVETGSPIEIQYTVVNGGEAPLTGCSITESNPELASCVPPDFEVPVGGPPTTFECAVPCITGVTDAAEPDTATVACDCSIDPPNQTVPVDDDDTANFTCVDARVAIDKLTNGSDAHQAFVGDPVEWQYTITNPGNVVLDNCVCIDDAGTPGDPGDDFPCCDPTPENGDGNGNGRLDPGEIWTCTADGIAQRGAYTNNATVTCDPLGGVPPQVSASDPSSYTGLLCDVALNREVACDCDPTDGSCTPAEFCELEIDGTKNVKFKWTVSNEGDLDAQLCEISDGNAGLNALTSFPIGIGDVPVGGSTMTSRPSTEPPGPDCFACSSDLDEPDPVFAEVDCRCVLPGQPPKPVTDSDSGQLRCRTACEIAVDKQISCDFGYSFIDVGFNDDVTEMCLAADDMQPIEIRYVIKNLSMDPVSSCTLADSNPELDLSGCAIPATLAPDEEYVCQIQETCLDPSDEAEPDTATAECQCDGGGTATDTDSAWFDCRDCDADVDRQISCDGGTTWTDEGYRDQVSGACAANNGDPIQVRYLVRNRSVKSLWACTISDSNTGILNAPIETGYLPKGFEGVVHTVDFACGAQYDSGGPDTVSIDCDCEPTCQETNPMGAGYCLPNCPPDVSAADSDQSQLTCN